MSVTQPLRANGPNPRRHEYEDRGFTIVRSLIDRAELDRALVEATALYDRQDFVSLRNLRCRFQINTATNAAQLETFDPIIDLCRSAAELARHPRLLEVLSELYGEPARLFKDKLIYKPPGCPGYDLHQDWIAWPGFPRSFLTVLIPLESTGMANGCTVAYPGYHKSGSLSAEDGNYHPLPRDLVDESVAVPLELEPGDVAIFSGFTPHCSGINQSDRWRRQLYLSFNKLSDGGEQRDAHYAEFHHWLREKYGALGPADLYFE